METGQFINVAVVGSGYWGINYVRVFNELQGSKVTLVCDTAEPRLRAVRERFPLINTTTLLDEALASRWVDVVIVATPASTHYAIASKFLAAGKHVLIEKPITTTTDDAVSLIRQADEKRLTLMVGHTFLYNSGVLKLKALMSDEQFGKVYYLHAARTNMGPVREDVNALWDLGAHDVAIFNYLLDAMPISVSTVASKVLGKAQEDVGFVSLTYPNGVIANIHTSWVDPNKVREVVVVGNRRRIVFDDLNSMERVRIYEKGMSTTLEANTYGEYRLIMRDGDIISPRVENSEPLKNLAQHFLDCVNQHKQPLTDGRNGLDVVRVMAAIDQSLHLGGAPVQVSQ